MKEDKMKRREFLKIAGLGAASVFFGATFGGCEHSQRGAGTEPARKPNLVFVFADQLRAQATGYAGDPNALTPHLDKLAAESINFTNAVSGCPVCSPYRASLMTGRYPLTHGIFLNDLTLSTEAVSIAQAYNRAGYETGYIGKWHLDGHGRSNFIPRQRRQGFKFWKVLECTHNYNNSFYYGDENVKLKWPGYDTIAQTKEAQRYIRDHAGGPFALFLSWGTPHAPYGTAPQKYKDMFEVDRIQLRPNVPEKFRARSKEALAGYYAHTAALDDCIGELVRTLNQTHLAEDTILVFTSDHGDMLGSQGEKKKQRPWDESIRVPFLLRYPAAHGAGGRRMEMPINTPDIMPTLLSLSGIEIPATVEGTDFSGLVRGGDEPGDNAVLISCPSPFGQWKRKYGGREYRGVRTKQYTYVRDLNGPWLLYDNQQDPYQLNNLCNKPEHSKLQRKLESMLMQKLRQTNDGFLPGSEYIRKWGYTVDKSGTVPYDN
jgi:arylsulfatase A-like enzyme